jgi:hypothetical protein
MSFVYAEKNPIDEECSEYSINILSDTKTTLTGAVLVNWSERQRKAIEDYGFIKSMIISPSCCVSFAGNDTSYAQKLLKWIFEKGIVSDEEMLEKAMQLHMEAHKDDIEFIICSSDTGKPCIYYIKNGNMFIDVSSAWIGSQAAFDMMQKLRLTQDERIGQSKLTSTGAFRRAVNECGDDSVGGFIIQSVYNGNEFFYPCRYQSAVSKSQIVQPGEYVRLFDTAANGGYSVHFRESKQDVIMDFEQIDTSIIYTSRYRYAEDIDNPYTKHLMLPFKFCTSKGLFI